MQTLVLSTVLLLKCLAVVAVVAAVLAMQPTYSFQVSKAQLSLAFAKAELALSAAVQLAQQCRALFLVQPLLTAVDVVPDDAADDNISAEAAGGVGWLGLTFVEADKQLKVKVQLQLEGLLGDADAGRL